MPRKVPLDPCIFCNNLPCTCEKPIRSTQATRIKSLPEVQSKKAVEPERILRPVRQGPLVQSVVPDNVVNVELPAFDSNADLIRNRMVSRATIVKPPTAELAAVVDVLAGSTTAAPAASGPAPVVVASPGQVIQHQTALDLLVTRLGARPVGNDYEDPAKDPSYQAKVVRAKYEQRPGPTGAL